MTLLEEAPASLTGPTRVNWGSPARLSLNHFFQVSGSFDTLARIEPIKAALEGSGVRAFETIYIDSQAFDF